MFVVSRTVTELAKDGESGERTKRTLEEIRDLHAFVLLGDPGAGKSTTFLEEARASGGTFTRAYDFIALSQSPGDWQGKTIFIDGFDESRAGSPDGRTVLDAIRSKLDSLGRPRFRLSCRAADWLGQSDVTRLHAIVPSGATLGVYHLDPLTVEDVKQILSRNFQIDDTDAFIWKAEQHQVDELLFNPQTLEMLASAVGKNGKWPSSRFETFQLAIANLLQETNHEHKAAKKNSTNSRELILAAAGYLSCIYLIADIHGFSQISGGNGKIATLSDIENPADLPLARCLETRAFRSVGNDLFAPVHRTVAEYLSAQFLAKTIEDGLPVGRLLAMICGSDGGVVTSLRGLHAWLAFYSVSARKKLIANDPHGILLYGDVKSFATHEKLLILEELYREAKFFPSFRWRDWRGRPFGALATPDMAAAFERILRTPSSNPADQAIAYCIVEAIEFGESIEALGPTLLYVIRADNWPVGIRKGALYAYLKKYSTDTDIKLSLLKDIQDGVIEDRDDELAGVLLRELYPTTLSPSKIVEYLHPRKDKNLVGSFSMFWHYDLVQKAPDDSLIDLVSAFSRFPVELKSQITNGHDFWRPISNLLLRAVLKFGDTVPNDTLFEWFGVCLDEYDHSHLDQDDRAQLHAWLAERPDRYKGLLRVALNKAVMPDEIYPWRAIARLHEAQQPTDLGAWWFAQAVAEPSEQLAENYFCCAFGIDHDGKLYGADSIEQLESWASERSGFEVLLRKRLVCELHVDDWRLERAKTKRNQAMEKKARADTFRAALLQVKGEEAHPHELDALACAYLGHYAHVQGGTALDRLGDFLNGDGELVAASICALKNSLHRSDLPNTTKILSYDRNGEISILTRPILVGLELLFQSDPTSLTALSDELLVEALVSRYVYNVGEEPAWFSHLVTDRAELVARAFLTYARAKQKVSTRHFNGTYQLAYDERYVEVAKQTVPILLLEFPMRARGAQLPAIENILKAAIRHLPHSALAPTVGIKLESKNMDVAQRVYWLATGLIVDTAAWETKLAAYVAGSETRRKHLKAFLYARLSVSENFEFPTTALEMLIGLFGPKTRPSFVGDDEHVTPKMERGELVEGWINQLATRASLEASAALRRLEELKGLRQWSFKLRHAQAAQQITMRDTHFQHPMINAVTTTLNKGKPANAADIAAIVNEVLADITEEVQVSDLNIYKQFWNIDPHGKPVNPKPENTCRDALAALLRERLRKYSIECGAEGNHADQTRSDVWCTYESWGVPVEAKRNKHPELWRAISEQLIAKYSLDTRSQGFGIYVVFWFGVEGMPKPIGGTKPANASALAEQLEAQIGSAYRKLIAVHVINCVKQNIFARAGYCPINSSNDGLPQTFLPDESHKN